MPASRRNTRSSTNAKAKPGVGDNKINTPSQPSSCRIGGRNLRQLSIGFPVKKSNIAVVATNKVTLSPICENEVMPRKRFASFSSGKALTCSPSKVRRNLYHSNSDENYTPMRLENDFAKKQNHHQILQPEETCYQRTKQVLHASVPSRLLCRDKELDAIKDFLKPRLQKQKPGSLYISGAPGTGKTACVTSIVNKISKGKDKCTCIFINCMMIKSPQMIFNKIANALDSGQHVTTAACVAWLEKKFITSSKPILLILDEMDQLDCKDKSVLYSIFEWTALPESKFVLIGIANALDLTDRILPRLEARPHLKPQLLHFPPFTRQEISTIIHDRVNQLEDILEPVAINFCARKVAAVAGDMRKALDVCRRAVEIIESQNKVGHILEETSDDGCNPGSPRKTQGKSQSSIRKVGLVTISNVLSQVYDNKVAHSSCGNSQESTGLPLQQKLLVCTLLLMTKAGKTKEVAIGKLHEVYIKVCKKRHLTGAAFVEFFSLCTLVDSQGVISLKKAKDLRLSKVTLNLDEKELEFALQDKFLLSSVIEAGMP